MMKRLVIAVLVVCVGVLSACEKIGPGQFEKYTRNNVGVKRMKTYIQDTSIPVDDRVEGVLALIKAGWYEEIRGIIDGCGDKAVVAEKVCDSLLKLMAEAGADVQKVTPLKEAFLSALTQAPDEQKGRLQQGAADWAFAGLSLASSEEDVKRQIEPRMALNDVEKLGLAGTKGATILAKYGFGTDRMAQYVIESGDRDSKLMLLEALKAQHQIPDVVIPFSHLEAIGKIKDPLAAVYLLDLANDKTKASDIQAAAFNEAAGLMEDPKVLEGDRTGIIERLDRLGNSKNPDDRWSAVNFMVVIEGDKGVDKIMNYLKNDGVYVNATEDVMKTMVDFCSFVVFKKGRNFDGIGFAKKLLASSNKVHRTLGVVCAKASKSGDVVDSLKGLTTSTESVQDVLGEPLTLGGIAKNAIEGIGMFDEVAADLKAGKINAKDAESMDFFILVDLASSGREYRKSVAERFRDDVAAKQ